MKALILAAGMGTRLEPYTKEIPKPLFTLASRPMIAHAIDQLVAAGCEGIVVNTHHLNKQISAFIDGYDTRADIKILYEPAILDTGGAIANARPFLEDAPFFVVNADVISTIDLPAVYRHHLASGCLATLVLHDFTRFNKVKVDQKGLIAGFDSTKNGLAFTGVQVVSPQIYHHLPDKAVFSSIDLYRSLCPQKQVDAYIDNAVYWSDIGTPESYTRTSVQILCARYFKIALTDIHTVTVEPLAGDGSDRSWSRATFEDRSVIVCNHGICLPGSDKDLECRAFIKIGTHLNSHSLNTPEILDYDRLSGIVLLEDLGDTHLQSVTREDPKTCLASYQKTIDRLIDFSRVGAENFNLDWTCQTHTYSKDLILDKECRYFIEAFVNGYLGLEHTVEPLQQEFETIAAQALEHGITGLMHRDFQSRNIMVDRGNIYFIDFQSARMGPLQYDLASLLIDPYVNLDAGTQKTLLHYTMEQLNLSGTRKHLFIRSYIACCLTRTLQALGAYGYLTRVKNKKAFEQYIPGALKSLDAIIRVFGPGKIPKLSQLIGSLKGE